MHSLLDIVKKTTDFFSSKGVDNARFNAEVLIGHALGLKRMQLYVQFERLLSEAELERIRPLVRRRAQREPLAYVTGETEFCDLRILCDKRALIPRPETEELVELVQKSAEGHPVPARILDLGTGTGCLALALARLFPQAAVTAVDASAEALDLARSNAALNGLNERVLFVQSDWFTALPSEPPFDLVVSNPPYLTRAEVAEAEPEVREHEPHSALEAAEAGLSDLRQIIRGAVSRISPGGLLALETGIEQHAALLREFAEAGYVEALAKADLSGRPRFVSARRPS